MKNKNFVIAVILAFVGALLLVNVESYSVEKANLGTVFLVAGCAAFIASGYLFAKGFINQGK
jgi:drug/metabolite transporter (DMT)-like permease